MKLKIAITTLICGAQILVCAPVFAAPISSVSAVPAPPRKVAQADMDAASAAGLETVYKFKKHSGSRSKSRAGKHGKRGRGRKRFASATTEAAPAAATSAADSCCAGSPM